MLRNTAFFSSSDEDPTVIRREDKRERGRILQSRRIAITCGEAWPLGMLFGGRGRCAMLNLVNRMPFLVKKITGMVPLICCVVPNDGSLHLS